MQLAYGTVVEDRYKVLEPVKAGGMGAVYKAQDARLAGGICAIKQMHDMAALGSQAEIVQYRFNEEMQVLCNLRHQGIPRVMDFFRYGGSWCIVMDFIEGDNLQQMRKAQALSQDFVVNMGIQVLDILIYLHQMDPPVVHRDIKPANLIVESKTGHIKLVDFGLARSVDVDSDLEQTLVGTPGYAPPEQLHGRSEPRSDIYSLGATMGSLLSGVLPGAFIQVGIRELLPDMNPQLADAIDRALQYYPEERFHDAAAMRADLLQVQHQLASREAPSDLEGPVTDVVHSAIIAEAEGDDQRERILIVDDDLIVRTVIEAILEKEHYHIFMAENGQEALQMALKIKPDLVISDVDMPGMDGVKLCQKLKSYRTTREIPVILLTANADVEDEAAGLEAGAEDFVVKPVVAQRLIARVQAVLRRRFSRRS